jgi:hypothetical protein
MQIESEPEAYDYSILVSNLADTLNHHANDIEHAIEQLHNALSSVDFARGLIARLSLFEADTPLNSQYGDALTGQRHFDPFHHEQHTLGIEGFARPSRGQQHWSDFSESIHGKDHDTDEREPLHPRKHHRNVKTVDRFFHVPAGRVLHATHHDAGATERASWPSYSGPSTPGPQPLSRTNGSPKAPRGRSQSPIEPNIAISPLHLHPKRHVSHHSTSQAASPSQALTATQSLSDPLLNLRDDQASPINLAVLSPVPHRLSIPRIVDLINGKVRSEDKKNELPLRRMLWMRRAVSPVMKESAYDHDLDDGWNEHTAAEERQADSVTAHHRWRWTRNLMSSIA